MADDDDVRKDDDTTSDDEQDDRAEPDWKAEARKWERRAKANGAEARKNADAANRLKETEDADRSEVEKLTARVATAEKRAVEAEAKALKAEIAQEKGLTAGQAKRLHGETREDIEADADELLEAFGGTKSDKDDTDDGRNGESSRRTPKENLRPGAANEDTEAPMDRDKADKLAASIESSGF
jgi:hypothetical protein